MSKCFALERLLDVTQNVYSDVTCSIISEAILFTLGECTVLEPTWYLCESFILRLRGDAHQENVYVFHIQEYMRLTKEAFLGLSKA